MTTVKKISSTLNENYNFSNENAIGTVSLTKDKETDTITQLNGQVYQKNADGTQGAYIGNFNGTLKDGEMVYTTSQMNRQKHGLIMELVGELESQFITNSK